MAGFFLLIIGVILVVGSLAFGMIELENLIISLITGVGIILFFIGIELIETDQSMKKYSIDSQLIEYIYDKRNNTEKSHQSLSNIVEIYIECKERNNFTDKETLMFLVPELTEKEADSILITYDLLEEEK